MSEQCYRTLWGPYAKANPGKINYASQGIATSHMTAELFQTITHTKLTHVPYKGTAPAVNDLLAGMST